MAELKLGLPERENFRIRTIPARHGPPERLFSRGNI